MISTPFSEEVFARLANVVRDEFGCFDVDISPETAAFDIDGWDSLTHTTLLMRIETAFGIRLPIEQVMAVENLGALAALVQSLIPAVTAADAGGATSAAVQTRSEAPTRWVLFHGNCQMQTMVTLLGQLLSDRGYRAEHIWGFLHPDLNSEPRPEQVANCAVLVEQVWANDGPKKVRAEAFAGQLPADCRRLRVPTLLLKSLWPLNAKDPRNVTTEGHPFGKHAYGDSLVTRLMRESSDPEEVFRRYMDTDLRKVIDLDRWHELCMAEVAIADKLTDLPFGGLYETNFRSQRMFDAHNHPAHALLERMSQALLAFILDDDTPLPATFLERPLGQIPIHPQVIEHFKLEWVTPSSRYVFRGNERPMTFEEWLRALIAFE